MSARPDLRRGWCPSTLRPMPSGDGLLLRLRLTCGVLAPTLARGIADCARHFGNGLVDLTRHGNLQLRGVGEAAVPALQRQLCELVPALAEEAPEAARNIIASPLAGLDHRAICDIRPVVAALEKRLAGDPATRALPAKFSFIIDDGGRLGVDDIATDIRFEAEHDGDEPRFAVSLGGFPDTATPIGSCSAAELPEMAAALALAFLELRGNGNEAPRRMRDLVDRIGADAIAEAVLRARQVSPGRGCEIHTSSTGEEIGTGAGALIGFHVLGNEVGFAGVGAPFGRVSADQLDHLADAAETSQAELRLTPWRAVLIAPIDKAHAAELQLSLAHLGLITEPADPLLAIAACPGAPACANAGVATREDALLLAPLARGLSGPRGGIGLHLSGCPKGCAKSDATPVTLVGRDGRYDVVFGGKPGDVPAYSGLTAQEAKALLLRTDHRRDVPAMIENKG